MTRPVSNESPTASQVSHRAPIAQSPKVKRNRSRDYAQSVQLLRHWDWISIAVFLLFDVEHG